MSIEKIKEEMKEEIDRFITEKALEEILDSIKYDFETGYVYDEEGILEVVVEYLHDSSLITNLAEAISSKFEKTTTVINTVEWIK